MSLRHRIDQLESRTGTAGNRLVQVDFRPGEPEAEALARCEREQRAATDTGPGFRLVIINGDAVP